MTGGRGGALPLCASDAFTPRLIDKRKGGGFFPPFVIRAGVFFEGKAWQIQVMDHPLIDLVNARIQKAEEEGAFDNLKGAGKPLRKVEDPENEMINRLLRENGAVPEFVTLSRELARLREELRETGDRSRRNEIMKEMSMMDARIELARKTWRR